MSPYLDHKVDQFIPVSPFRVRKDDDPVNKKGSYKPELHSFCYFDDNLIS